VILPPRPPRWGRSSNFEVKPPLNGSYPTSSSPRNFILLWVAPFCSSSPFQLGLRENPTATTLFSPPPVRWFPLFRIFPSPPHRSGTPPFELSPTRSYSFSVASVPCQTTRFPPCDPLTDPPIKRPGLGTLLPLPLTVDAHDFFSAGPPTPFPPSPELLLLMILIDRLHFSPIHLYPNPCFPPAPTDAQSRSHCVCLRSQDTHFSWR